MANKSKINVLIADDHNLIRIGLRHILDSVPGIKVVGEAVDGEEALKFVKNLSPQVVLFDIKMPSVSGLEAARKMLKIKPDLKILAISIFDDAFFPAKFMEIGVNGYLTKETNKTELIQAIHAVSLGQRFISPRIAQKLVLQHFEVEDKSPFSMLSDRELQIATLVSQGIKTKEVAAKLHLTMKTVNSYRYRIFAKLNLKGDVGLARLAQKFQMVD